MNAFKENIETKVETQAALEGSGGGVVGTMKKASEFSFFLNKDSLNKMLPSLFLGAFIAILYIFMSHFHVKSLKEKEQLKTELNELRSEYISAKSLLMKQSNQSEVAKRLESLGIKELRTPPAIIEVKKEN